MFSINQNQTRTLNAICSGGVHVQIIQFKGNVPNGKYAANTVQTHTQNSDRWQTVCLLVHHV